MKTAAILIIGNEILSGRTKDANLHWLAGQLTVLGIRLAEARVVADVADDIIHALDALRTRYAYVFTTGGIGPTHDDITTECVARAFGVPVVRHPDAEQRIRGHYPPEMLNAARLKMADVPEGAALIDNPISSAPGYIMGNVYVMAGVPSIMCAMFESVRHGLSGGPPMQSLTLSAFTTEGYIAEALAAIQARHPQVEIGSYPSLKPPRPGVSIVLRAVEVAPLLAAAEEVRALLAGFAEVTEGELPQP